MNNLITYPAIVCPAYNRPHCLQRLLNSIAKGKYPNGINIPLVISLDKSDNTAVLKIASDFDWQYGTKKIIQHDNHLGLRKHILNCGDLTQQYEAIVLLEDDLFVSPYFYQYAKAALQFYAADSQIGGISLYNYQIAESCFYPFMPIENGSDVYFIQFASSWGQVWTAAQWQDFRTWYADNHLIHDSDLLPHFVKEWPDYSWKKRFIKYLIDKDKYFVFPRLSLTTNFGEQGTTNVTKGLFQVPLQAYPKQYQFSSVQHINSHL